MLPKFQTENYVEHLLIQIFLLYLHRKEIHMPKEFHLLSFIMQEKKMKKR